MSAPFEASCGMDLDEPGRAPWEAPCLHWTALFLVSLTHGGDEEGSWWFDSGELVTDPAFYARLGALPTAFLTIDQAQEHAARMAVGVDAQNEGRPPKHSVLSTGVYEVHVLEAPCLPLHWPETPPRYE